MVSEKLNFCEQPKVLFSAHVNGSHVISDDGNWHFAVTRNDDSTFSIGMVIDKTWIRQSVGESVGIKDLQVIRYVD